MSSLEGRERESILAMVLNKIPETELLDRMGWSVGAARARSRELLEHALATRTPEEVSFGLYLAFRFGSEALPLQLVTDLLGASWHRSHEDLVSVLSEQVRPESANALYEAALAKHEYLAFDESHALAVKAIYALGQIGTVESTEFLVKLASSSMVAIQRSAREQLSLDDDVKGE